MIFAIGALSILGSPENVYDRVSECKMVNQERCYSTNRQQCDTFSEQQCSTIKANECSFSSHEEQCTITYETVTEDVCSTTYNKQCLISPKKSCVGEHSGVYEGYRHNNGGKRYQKHGKRRTRSITEKS